MGIVTLAIFGVIGVMNQHDRQEEVDRALERAITQSSRPGLPGLGLGFGERQRDEAGSRIPVYCVTVYSDGTIYANDTSTASMDSDLAAQAVDEALETGQAQGRLSDYGLFFRVESSLASSRVAFADTTTFMNDVLGFYLYLLALWFLLMLLVFFITLFLSRLVTRPVVEAWETQQQFVADASHELKTPLTVILADASILAENPQATVAEQSQWVESISTEAERMQQLTEGMLMLAQADAGADLSAIMSAVDFSNVVESTLLQFEAVAFERGLMLDDSITPGLVVQGDQLRLEGLIKTLLENACKYSAKPGTIAARLSSERGQAVLEVHNMGDPIPDEDLPHLFDRFYRSDKSRVREGETASFGLGLSIAKSTVELHGGRIEARSSAADGTTFTVRLPLSR